MNIIGYAINRDLGIFNSLGQKQSTKPYIPFLLKDKDAIKVLSNIDFDVAALLPLLGLTDKELDKLATNKTLSIPPYKILYYPDKFFSIDEGIANNKVWVNFSDVAQYEPQLNEIDTIQTDDYYFARAKLAQEVGEKVYQSFIALGFHPQNIISPVNVFRKEAMPKDLPTMVSLKNLSPEQKHDLTVYSYECCHGSLSEAYKKGHFPHVTDIDLNSAFSSVASKLLHPDYGRWVYSKDFLPDATYGYCKCEVMIDLDFSPIIYSVSRTKNFTPKGIWETYLTKTEIDFIHEYNTGYATCLGGWFWYPTKEYKPLEKLIVDFYKKKQAATGMNREILKRMMAGAFYGLFLETKNDNSPGEHFYPPWGAQIEAEIRITDAKFVLDNHLEKRLLSIAVDGLDFEGDINIKNSDELGGWRISHTGKCVIVCTNTLGIESKYGQGDFSLSYDKLVNLLDSEDDKWHIKKPSVKTLGVCSHNHNYKELGRICELTKTIDLNDIKRLYPSNPTTGKELLAGQFESKPWNVSLLKLMTDVKQKEFSGYKV